MKEELEQQLVKKFPGLFAGKDRPPTESLMCFGCECSDGWYKLIETTCSLIASYLKNRPEVPPFEFVQIKEKFGGLRLYNGGGDDFTFGVCTMAESMSYQICEATGERGQLCTTGHWLRTLSPAEAKKCGYRPARIDDEDDKPSEATDGSEEKSSDSNPV